MPKNGEHFHILDRRWNRQVVWKRSGVPKIHLQSGITLHEEKSTKMIFKESGPGLNR